MLPAMLCSPRHGQRQEVLRDRVAEDQPLQNASSLATKSARRDQPKASWSTRLLVCTPGGANNGAKQAPRSGGEEPVFYRPADSKSSLILESKASMACRANSQRSSQHRNLW